MNSVRIAVAGVIADRYGIEWLDGFTHFFEGWVIFLICIVLLFLLAWLMVFLRRDKLSLLNALDLDTSGWGTQAMRLRHLRASPALIIATGIAAIALLAWQAVPENRSVLVARDSFSVFPRTLGDWQQTGAAETLEPAIAARLQADDYHSITLNKAGSAASVGLFMAWYQDQTQGGVHSPEICLPASGWEIAWLERSELSRELALDSPFNLNRAIIQKGETRMLVYYWFQQGSRTVAWDIAAKFHLLMDGIRTGQTDGGMIRLTTLIARGESDAEAEARLQEVIRATLPSVPRFMPEDA